jgi:hypothetical protein
MCDCVGCRTSWTLDEVEAAVNAAIDEHYPYVYRWDRCGRKGQRCAVTARGKLNSCRVVFVDGEVMITSRNALRRAR